MEEMYLLNHPGVKKKILAGGKGPMPHFPNGTKLVFHFQTLLDNFERTVIDDSRLAGRPAEIFVGKMFKMEVWETLLMSMRVGEVAEFWCDAVHTGLYPIVSKGMRLIAEGKDPLDGQRHMCGMGNMFHYHSTGFPELDELMRTPQPLIFIMELLQVGDPLSYHRESWMMEKDEKLQMVPVLHMQGNSLVKQKEFREAASKYKEAVLLLKTVQSREMPGDVDYINLGRMIVPLELNYCQCMLELEEYYEVIEHTTELLEKHKDCVKGYYKRAKAHTAVWNEKEARKDFNTVVHLDITLASLVHRELKALSERMKEKYWEEKELYWKKLEKKSEEQTDEDKETYDKDKQEDPDSVAISTEDESGKKGCDEVEMKVTPSDGIMMEASCSTINLKTCDETEEKDWQQMLRLMMFLQNEGKFLIKEKRFPEAAVKFKEALEYVNKLQNKVDQKGEDCESLEKVCLPISLNLSQCMLEMKQYKEVVELNNELLKKHKGNFKALYHRARAHAALCHEDEARRDFAIVEKLDPSFKPFVKLELKKMGDRIRALHVSQNKTYQDATAEKWGPGGRKAKSASRKKSVKSNQKTTEEKGEVDEKTKSHEVREKNNSEVKLLPQKKVEEDPGTKGNLDAEAEQKKKETEIGCTREERLELENPKRVVAPETRPGEPDNSQTDKDSDPVAAGSGKDNVASKRSTRDKGRKKVKCQSSGAPNQSRASRGNKSSSGKTGKSVPSKQAGK